MPQLQAPIKELGAVDFYSHLKYPEKSPDELRRILINVDQAGIASDSRASTFIHNLQRRLGHETINQIVADYTAGKDTLTIAADHNISKTSVLKLLRAEGITLRHQALSEDAADPLLAQRRFEEVLREQLQQPLRAGQLQATVLS